MKETPLFPDMTYKKLLENKQETLNKKELFDESLRNLMQEMEINISASDIQSLSNCRVINGDKLSEDDKYKLLCIMEFDDIPICEINTDSLNPLIIGCLGSLNEEPDIYELCKFTYCRNPKLGSFITSDNLVPFYAVTQNDNLFSNLTIGKVVKLYEKYKYFDDKGTPKTEGEYLIYSQKKLQLNDNPSVIKKNSGTRFSSTSLVRRPSSNSLSKTGVLAKPQSGPSSTLNSSTNCMNRTIYESPRKTVINRYQLVKYI